MESGRILKALGQIDASLIEEAAPERRVLALWRKRLTAVAAIFCLLLGARQVSQENWKRMLMTFEPGADMVSADEVWPPEVTPENTLESISTKITPEGIRDCPLAEYLPTWIPQECEWNTGGFREIVTKSGNSYKILTVLYTVEVVLPVRAEGEGSPGREIAQKNALWFKIRNFPPPESSIVLGIDTLTLEQLKEEHGARYVLDFGNVWVTIEPMEYPPEVVYKIIQSIGAQGR